MTASAVFQSAGARASTSEWPTTARMPEASMPGAMRSMLPSRSAMQVTPFSRNSAQAARTESTWSSTVKLSWPGMA